METITKISLIFLFLSIVFTVYLIIKLRNCSIIDQSVALKQNELNKYKNECEKVKKQKIDEISACETDNTACETDKTACETDKTACETDKTACDQQLADKIDEILACERDKTKEIGEISFNEFCEGREGVNIVCPIGQTLTITNGILGGGCSTDPLVNNNACVKYIDVTQALSRKIVNNKITPAVIRLGAYPTDLNVGDPCPGISKKLKVAYKCTTPTTST